MKKTLLALMLFLLPVHAFALPHFYVGVGTVSGDNGKKETAIFENGENLAITKKDYYVGDGYGLSLGFSVDNVSLESKYLSYSMKDKDAPIGLALTDVTEQTTHLVGNIGTNFLSVRLIMGFGEAKVTPGDKDLPKATFDVISKGIGIDLNISLLGKTRIFVDYYDNSYKNTDFNNSRYQRDLLEHSLIYMGMSFPIRWGFIAKGATPG